METHAGEGVGKEKSPHSRKPSHRHVCGEFWNLRGQHNWGEKKFIAYVPNRTASGEAQRLASTTSEWELGREGCIIDP